MKSLIKGGLIGGLVGLTLALFIILDQLKRPPIGSVFYVSTVFLIFFGIYAGVGIFITLLIFWIKSYKKIPYWVAGGFSVFIIFGTIEIIFLGLKGNYATISKILIWDPLFNLWGFYLTGFSSEIASIITEILLLFVLGIPIGWMVGKIKSQKN